MSSLLQCKSKLNARSLVYHWLGRLWLFEIDSSLADEMCSEPISTTLREWGFPLDSLEHKETLEELAVDYCHVLVGPGHVSPIQSVNARGLLQSSVVDSMSDYLNFVHVQRNKNQILDHFGFQLTVMGAILGSPVNDDHDLVEEIAAAFFRDHIAWSNAIFEQCFSRARSKFYKTFLSITDDFVSCEQQHYRDLHTAKSDDQMII